MISKKKNRSWQGMNWIRQEKRLAIYLRDGMACVYCGSTVEDGTRLTLDHLKPHVEGGSNHETNLVTCCHRCNSSRGSRSVTLFVKAVAVYLNHGANEADILSFIRKTVKRKLDVKAAKIMIASRGLVVKIIQ